MFRSRNNSPLLRGDYLKQYKEIDGIGPVLFERSKRAKRIILTVNRDGRIRVAVPSRASFAEAEQFAHMKKNWINKQLDRLNQQKPEPQELLLKLDLPAANQKLIDRFLYLSSQHKFTFNRLTIRNQKTRWGSCSTRNNISLNIKLAILSEELMDYVIFHELVHTRIKNHSQKFWTELARYVDNPKQVARELKKYRPGLI